jgi:hypothetical protein
MRRPLMPKSIASPKIALPRPSLRAALHCHDAPGMRLQLANDRPAWRFQRQTCGGICLPRLPRPRIVVLLTVQYACSMHVPNINGMLTYSVCCERGSSTILFKRHPYRVKDTLFSLDSRPSSCASAFERLRPLCRHQRLLWRRHDAIC